jgi:AcrR family transcriptional regulator
MSLSETHQESRQDTKQLILDAAEKLFAREGFHNTSLRAITGEAGVNLASVNYHFGSKVSLLEAVFDRRLIPLNKLRRERLEQVRSMAQEEDHPPRPNEIFQALFEPTLAFRESGPGAENFVTLAGRALSEPSETEREIFIRRMEPIFMLALETLQEALPEISPELLFWRLQFAIGALSHTMRMYGKFPLAPEGIQKKTDIETLTKMLVEFVTAGMEGG